MRTGIVSFGAVLALALAAPLAHGTSIVSAPFNNTSVWTVATGETALGSLSTQLLSYTFDGTTISSGGTTNSTLMARYSGQSGAEQNNVAVASLGSAISGGSAPAQIWASFLFQYQDTQANSPISQFGILWLDGSSSSVSTGFGFELPATGGDPGVADDRLKGGGDSTGGSLLSGTTYFFVAELTNLGPGGNYRTLNVWLDPTGLGGTPTVTVTGQIAPSSLTEIGVEADINSHDTLYFGAPSLSTTEQGLLTPEPSVFALTGIGLLGLGLLRRRKAD